MPNPYWPLFDLRLTTPRLELRLPGDGDLVRLADVVAGGLYDPDVPPLIVAPWVDEPSPRREWGLLQYHWRCLADWDPGRWTLPLMATAGGQPIGVQALAGTNFAVTRAVSTRSWLGRPYQGQGLGTEMRVAVLHLAFHELGAEVAYSEAWEDNLAALAISRRLGYRDNGEQVVVRRGVPVRLVGLRLERPSWQAARKVQVAADGLEPCLDMFLGGAGTGTRTSGRL
jgi:RimJ/RimL family protein N-acetyltransferase